MNDVEIVPYSDSEDDLFRVTSNPNFVTIKLRQSRLEMNGDFLNEKEVFHYVKANISVVRNYNLAVGMKWKDVINMDCKIVVQESTDPYYAGQQPKINPRTRAVFHLIETGEPIYRRTRLTILMSDTDSMFPREAVEAVVIGATEQSSEFSGIAFERGIM